MIQTSIMGPMKPISVEETTFHTALSVLKDEG